jgi:hypothetical protein
MPTEKPSFHPQRRRVLRHIESDDKSIIPRHVLVAQPLIAMQHLTQLPWACKTRSGELNDHDAIVLKEVGGSHTVGVQRQRQAEMKAI